MADSTIGKAYVQIIPSAEGITGRLNELFGAPSGEAGKSAGASFGSGLLSALSDIGGKIGDIMKSAVSEVTAFVSDSVQTGMGFDTAMSQVAATMGKTTDEISDLREFAKEMGSETAFSATQSAEALNFMALAGYNAETSMKMLPNVMNLAAAGGMELARASDMVTDSQTALGLSLDETETLVDQMAKAASKTNTSVSQLGDAILTVGGTAKGLKGGTAELNQVLGIMADNGIKAGEAGTHLRNIMLAMNPTTDAAASAFKQLGLEAYDNKGNLREMSAIFGDLSKALDGMTDEERTDILTAMFNKTDLSTVNALLDTSAERWDEVAAELSDADGAAQAMADTQLDNLQGDITLMKSAFEGLQIAISDKVTPTLREFVQLGTDGLGKITEAFSKNGISGAAAALGEVFDELLAKASGILPDVMKVAVNLVKGFITAFSNALPAVLDAVTGAVPLVSQALKEIGAALVKNAPVLLNALGELVSGLIIAGLEMLPEFISGAVSILSEIANALSEYIPVILQTIVDALPEVGTALTEALPVLIEAAGQLIGSLIDALPELLAGLAEALPEILQGVLDALPVLIDTVNELLVKLGEILPEILPVILPAVTECVVKLIESTADMLTNNIMPLLDTVIEVAKTLAECVIDNIDLFADCVWEVIKAVGKAIYDNAPELEEKLFALIEKLIDYLPKLYDDLIEAGGDLIMKLADGFNSPEFETAMLEWGDSVLETFETIWTDIKDFWGGLWDEFTGIGKNIIGGIWEGIVNKWHELEGNITEWGDSVLETFCDIFDINSPSKVMEKLIGKNLALGIETGFTGEMDDVTKQMGEGVGAVIDELADVELTAAPTVQNAAFSQRLTPEHNIVETDKTSRAPTTLKIVINGREFAESIVNDINECLGHETVFDMGGYARS